MDFMVRKAAKVAYSTPLATSGYVGEVDALRCLAITAVIAQHCQLLPFGWTGVWLFFVISGFAITSSLLASDRTKHTKPILIRNFYVRRCLRIWPVYFLVVAGNLIAATSVGNSEIWASLPWLVTFTIIMAWSFMGKAGRQTDIFGPSVSRNSFISFFHSLQHS